MIHVIVAVFAVFGIVWALAILLVGGFTIALSDVTIQSHDPLRPLAVGAIAAAVYVGTRGPLSATRLVIPIAILLALSPAIAGIARNSWTAGGADQYAYVSQADLWLQRNLTVQVPLAATAPWPEAVLTFMPHGFRPAVAGPALVPVTAPGLPLLMAGVKAIAGHCALFAGLAASMAILIRPAACSSHGSTARCTDRRSPPDTDRCRRCFRCRTSRPTSSGTAAGSS